MSAASRSIPATSIPDSSSISSSQSPKSIPTPTSSDGGLTKTVGSCSEKNCTSTAPAAFCHTKAFIAAYSLTSSTQPSARPHPPFPNPPSSTPPSPLPPPPPPPAPLPHLNPP